MLGKEDKFVEIALSAAKDVIEPPLYIERGVALLYQITVDNLLNISVNPRHPTRGNSAFQTDLCVLEQKNSEIRIPRVVLEFKANISTHDVLTYSTKARKHKQIYPYLRYGIIIGNEETIPGRFFTHNESLDFCVAASIYKGNRLHELFSTLLREEISASRELEKIAYGESSVCFYRNTINLQTDRGKIS